MKNRGIFIGIILVLIQLNLIYGLPFFLLIILFFSNKINKKDLSDPLIILLILFIFWNILNIVIFDKQIYHGILYTMGALLLFFFRFNRLNYKIIEGINLIINILLLIDLIFNISIYFLGEDFLGRTSLTRDTDFLVRSGGLFNHPFISFNLSVISIMSNLPNRNWKLLLLSFVNIIFNGTVRGLVFIVQFCFFLFMIRKKYKLVNLISLSLIFAAFVYIITIQSSIEGKIASNSLRVYAWSNSMKNILENPFFGKTKFDFSNTALMDAIDTEIIEDQGISESTFLELGSHYGIISSILLFFILIRLLKYSYKENINHQNNINETILLFALVLFSDTFYGSIFGTVISTSYFAILYFQEKKSLSTWINENNVN